MISERLMPHTAMKLLALSLFVISGCTYSHAKADAASGTVETQFTSLKVSNCAQEIDKDDANDASYPVCPGIAGYRLQIRQVESGRSSINVVSPTKQTYELNYQNVVTRSMNELDDKAEWRVRKENGKSMPVALIVLVKVHGNWHEPAKITDKYWAVAKIASDKACVTDSVREGSKSAAEVRALADSAATRPCARSLPASGAAKSR